MIYLDNNSTTPVDPLVVESMLPFFSEHFGNAASTTHELGRTSKQAVEHARSVIAHAIGASEEEICFTSGATESNNLAIRGVCTHRSAKAKRIVSSLTEHRAVLDPIKRMSKEGFAVDYVETNSCGDFTQDSVQELLSRPLDLLSLSMANNEIGSLLNLGEFGKLKELQKFVFHCDAAQALGKIKIDLQGANIDLLSMSAHKIYGPKGVGALFVRRGTRLKAIMDGGGHESGKRSGTLNVPGIVGFGKAVELAIEHREAEEKRIRELMVHCDSLIHSKIGGATLNGPPIDRRLLGNLNYRLDGIDAETLTLNLTDLCISTGSACTSAEPEPSHVLDAIGLNESEARSSVRIGIGRFNTRQDIELAVEQMSAAVSKLRNQS